MPREKDRIMMTFPPIHEIDVPRPKTEEVYSQRVLEKKIRFKGLKKLLGAADISKAGDRNANLALKMTWFEKPPE